MLSPSILIYRSHHTIMQVARVSIHHIAHSNTSVIAVLRPAQSAQQKGIFHSFSATHQPAAPPSLCNDNTHPEYIVPWNLNLCVLSRTPSSPPCWPSMWHCQFCIFITAPPRSDATHRQTTRQTAEHRQRQIRTPGGSGLLDDTCESATVCACCESPNFRAARSP